MKTRLIPTVLRVHVRLMLSCATLLLFAFLTAPAQTKLIGLATEGGAHGGGTLFQLNTDGTELTTLYDFDSPTGSFPFGTLIQSDDGLLYGVTKYGGAAGFGTIFSIKPDGSDHAVLFEFTEETGSPAGSLLETKEGILFGMTTNGDAGFGTAYRINQDGTSYQEVYRFHAEGESNRQDDLMQATNGMIYGASYSGGNYQYGQVFRLDPAGSEPLILHSSWEDGGRPHSALIQATDGALYGVTEQGGIHGGGIIYRILPDAAAITPIRHFDYSQGYLPAGSLTQAPDGALYGMTSEGGSFNNGVLYKTDLDRTNFTTLEHFDGDNGKAPVGNLVHYQDHIYGYTTFGGTYDAGVIFRYNLISRTYAKLADLEGPSGEHPKFGSLLLLNPESAKAPTVPAGAIQFTNVDSHSMTLSFAAGNGQNHLIIAKAGNPPDFQPADDSVYFGNMARGLTIVYNGPKTTVDLTGLAPDTIHYFAIYEYNSDYVGNIRYLNAGVTAVGQRTSEYPLGATKLIGVTAMAGRYDAGTMFSINPDGTDYKVLFNFDGVTGGLEFGTLFEGKDGSLYGFSKSGGTHASGTLYKIRPDGTDHTVIYQFTRDNGFPAGPPLQTLEGTLFGISTHDEVGYGMVYKVNPDGSGHEEIYRFNIVSPGYHQPGFIMQASTGYLFATTYSGGVNGAGMILRLNADGSEPTLVHSFAGADGYFPYSVLTEARDGMLYGVTQFGGTFGGGVVYKIQPDGSDFSVVRNFDGFDVSMPGGALTELPDGAIAGIANFGGPYGWGSVYKLNTDGTGFETLRAFDGDSEKGPIANLTVYENKLYGYAAGGLFDYDETNGMGSLFSYDLENSEFQKHVLFTTPLGIKPTLGSVLVMNPRHPVAGVQNFSLIDTRTEEKLTDFDETVTLDVGDPDFRHWTIRANTYPDEVGSVVFKIDVQKKNVENRAPYLLAGHHLRSLSPTPHILEGEAYSERLGRGNRLKSRAALIRYINNTMVSSLTVLDAEGEIVQDLNDGDVINARDPLLRNFNIEALLNRDSDRGSVQFYVNGELFWTENRAPYIMVTGNRKWWTTPGLYTVTAIPYSTRNGGGLAGVPYTVTFTVSEMPTDQALPGISEDILTANTREQGTVSVYPVPAQDVLFLLPDAEFSEQDLMVVILDTYGETRFKKLITLTPQPYIMKLTEMGLNKGMYYIKLRSGEKTQMIRFIKESP